MLLLLRPTATATAAFSEMSEFVIEYGTMGGRLSSNDVYTNLQTRVAMMTHQAVQQQSALGCSSFLLRRQHRKME